MSNKPKYVAGQRIRSTLGNGTYIEIIIGEVIEGFYIGTIIDRTDNSFQGDVAHVPVEDDQNPERVTLVNEERGGSHVYESIQEG